MDMDTNKYNEIAEVLKALAHPVRLCIVRGLIEKGGCNVCHMQECLGMPQSTTSQHLQKLRSAGIISGQRKGLEVTYQVCDQRVVELIKVLFPEDK
ncbi:Transcriptional repressor PagR [bioreactor metagenome]|uniref:Transcriptional repressor PagR n=1 Tax=bioreactor metagenome TaxID=1076179 RepID=A0A644Z789_9ZZZZ